MIYRTMAVVLTLFLSTVFLFGQVEPSLTMIDEQGNAYWNPDNSTLMEAVPGTLFTLMLEGTPASPYGIYLSLLRTPYPLNLIPPPLLLMPPLYPVIAGPDLLLGPSGAYSFSAYVPPGFSSLGQDVEVYFQGFVQDPASGFRLTNGVTLRVVTARYAVRVALARGADLSAIAEFGELKDPDAGDNELPAGGGAGLKNGQPVTPDPDLMGGSTYAMKDQAIPPAGSPNPTTSIYLNGIFPLVPGDSGIDNRFKRYPDLGSSLYIHTRDRVCRSMENRYQQYIIAPVFDENGRKTHDLNIYHFQDRSKAEFGFMVVDCMNNDFYELKGTRKPGDAVGSLWDPSVAVSPDGRYMAAVLKNRPGGDVTEWKDKLFVIKLVKDDCFSDGNHARKVVINHLGQEAFWASRIYAESMTFGGKPDPHGLFFVTNKVDLKSIHATEPPPDVPASLWSLKAWKEQSKAFYHRFLTNPALPRAGGGAYPFIYFGYGHFYKSTQMGLSELKWLTAEDHSTICLRGAGRHSEWDSVEQEWLLGDWAFDILAVHDIRCDSGDLTYEIINITRFEEMAKQKGFYIAPFGHAYNGSAKAAMSQPDPKGLTYIAFTTENCTAKYQSEDLYVAATDGSLAGSLHPITTPVIFKGSFQDDYKKKRGMGVFDPQFMSANDLVFFCGRIDKQSGSYFAPEVDLFLYQRTMGEYRNLTQTAVEAESPFENVKEPVPPFTLFGTIRPAGLFSSRNGRYLFFLRSGNSGMGTGQKLNLVGVDWQSDFSLFDLTGDEFSHGFIPNLDHETIPVTGYRWGPETMSMAFFPAKNADLLFFTSKYQSSPANRSYQVFMVNMAYPIAAFPITSFNPSQEGLVDNLAADVSGRYVAFSRSNVVDTGSYKEGAYEKLYVADLSQGAFIRELSAAYPPYSRASIDGSFRFIPSTSPSEPPLFVFGMGLGGTPGVADNPTMARIWLYSLESITDPVVEPIPLTEEELHLLFNALPFDGR